MTYKYIAENYGDHLYFIFRVFVGLLFLQHGLQKLFGAFGDRAPVELFSLMGLAGIIEFSAGLAITLGIFTRLIASVAALELVVAYFMAHAPNGLIPIMNGGELALLYVASFLVLVVYGAKKWSLERALLKKEIF
jgi:putative oxidoreductase|tara:strand:+ start:221 stop:625 length:405 start_codon:yes stop_codon:yes gene_type:complete